MFVVGVIVDCLDFFFHKVYIKCLEQIIPIGINEEIIMTLPQLDEIKKMRIKYNLNQSQLAHKAGVSQSLIAKIESKKIDPTFARAKQIFEALEHLQDKEELKAKDLLNTKVVFTQSVDALKDIIKIMKQKGISQMPVLLKEKVIGIVTESTILNKIIEAPERINLLKASEVMEEVPPIVSLNTGMKTLSVLLCDNAIVLVADKGEIRGIISKADLLGKI